MKVVKVMGLWCLQKLLASSKIPKQLLYFTYPGINSRYWSIEPHILPFPISARQNESISLVQEAPEWIYYFKCKKVDFFDHQAVGNAIDGLADIQVCIIVMIVF